MVRLDILEKFLLTFIPDEAKNPIMDLMKQYRKMPEKIVATGFLQCNNFIQSENVDVRVATINGLVLGMLMAALSEKPEIDFFEKWLELHAREKGANVMDFMQAKSKKRRHI